MVSHALLHGRGHESGGEIVTTERIHELAAPVHAKVIGRSRNILRSVPLTSAIQMN